MTEISAGGVVYRVTEEDRLLFLLIEDRYGKMTLPKGKQEIGETIEETAIREVLEETGIRSKLVDQLETTHYQYHHPVTGEIVDKDVHFYLMEAYTSEVTVQVEEINGVQWVEPAVAWKLQQEKGYRNNDSVLRKALSHFQIEV
ncbi:NUDIX hydrolase [Brevibacillus fulvus]|uniref:8-oxo-dGTP pyrophosphatase MutT (NUDIX family) n=1 Tax=Brevibacillus fulvus TaxID=1125967 RepID=A0A938XYB0_9BACL|nr:NUDIX domain-containing protein [Brevibacillus fulvus]MBM7589873.1 8-oxo-dGTP pyrophosphatase MutT (NUDIX family) [Brevibacillus fulvus]